MVRTITANNVEAPDQSIVKTTIVSNAHLMTAIGHIGVTDSADCIMSGYKEQEPPIERLKYVICKTSKD
jgi:hypothetical protein